MSSYIGAIVGIAEGAYTSTRMSQLARKQRNLTYMAMIERKKQLGADIKLRNRELGELLGEQSAQAAGQGIEIGSGNVSSMRFISSSDAREDIRELEAEAQNDLLRMYLGMQVEMRAAKTRSTTRLLSGIGGAGTAAGDAGVRFYQGYSAKKAKKNDKSGGND